MRLVLGIAVLAHLLALIGCSRTEGPTEVVAPSPMAPGPDPAQGAVRLADVGPPLPHQRGAILQRGVSIHTDGGEMELKNAILTFGDANTAWRDPQTGKLAWRALTCTNPDCSSRASRPAPFIFVHSVRGARVDEAGEVQADCPPGDLIPVCPACRRSDRVEEYVLPEVLRRQAELDAELEISDTADRAGTRPPAGVRPPMEIIRERVLQPKLYLLAE